MLLEGASFLEFRSRDTVVSHTILTTARHKSHRVNGLKELGLELRCMCGLPYCCKAALLLTILVLTDDMTNGHVQQF